MLLFQPQAEACFLLSTADKEGKGLMGMVHMHKIRCFWELSNVDVIYFLQIYGLVDNPYLSLQCLFDNISSIL